jgi:hypothetical protein
MDQTAEAQANASIRPADHYVPGRQGLEFRAGKLYVFGPDRVVILRGGSAPATWSKEAEPSGRAGWFSSRRLADEVLRDVFGKRTTSTGRPPHHPAGGAAGCADGQQRPSLDRRSYSRSIAVSRFVATLPEAFLPLLKAVPEGAWRLYAFLARCGSAAQELAESHLPLAFALAHADRFQPVARPLRSARRLVAAERRAICGWLGFPAEPSAVHLLERIPPGALTVRRLRQLRSLLFENEAEAMTLLRHAPCLRGEVVDAFTAFRPALTPGLLCSLADPRTAIETRCMLGRLAPMLSALGRALGPIRDRAALQRLLAQTEPAWRHCDLRRHLPEELPAPPFTPGPGTGIEPLNTLTGLLDEGEAQRNCCASYATSVLAGADYLYRVTAPVRATLSITRRDDGSWGPGDLRLAGNGQVADDVRAGVFRLLLKGDRSDDDGDPEEWPTYELDECLPPF